MKRLILRICGPGKVILFNFLLWLEIDENPEIPALTISYYLMKIQLDSCMPTGFGFVEIDWVTYIHDVLTHTDGTISKREKNKSKGLKGEYGHTPLSQKELDFIALENPQVIYIGTGQYGSLPITSDAEELLYKYKSVIETTPMVISKLSDEKLRYVAILHVTC